MVFGIAGETRPKRRLWLMVLGSLVMAVALWQPVPAMAHGDEDGEANSRELVEQAMGILVSLPEASNEALERIEDVLVSKAEGPTGDVDLDALEEAATALERGDVEEAENLLGTALGDDPALPRTEQTVKGGLRSPSDGDSTALAVAGLLGVAGIALVWRRKAVR